MGNHIVAVGCDVTKSSVFYFSTLGYVQSISHVLGYMGVILHVVISAGGGAAHKNLSRSLAIATIVRMCDRLRKNTLMWGGSCPNVVYIVPVMFPIMSKPP